MPIDFPSNPTTNQIYTANAKAWIFTGLAWKSYQGSGFVANNTVNVVTATGGQTLFTTPVYTQGQNQIRVFINGVRQNNISDFAETSTSSITLTSGATAGDNVAFEVITYTGNPLVINTATVVNDNTTNSTYYPLYTKSIGGSLLTAYTSNTNFYFNPSTGTLTATAFSGNGANLINVPISGSGANLTNIPNSSLSNSSITINGSTVTLGSSVSIAAGATITNDTTSANVRYPIFAMANSGSMTIANTSSTKLTYTPLTGTMNVANIISGNHFPITSNTYDLGSSSLRWRNIYTGDLNLSNGIGDWTIVEGENDLFIYNNKSDKTFKFALIEVDPSSVPNKL